MTTDFDHIRIYPLGERILPWYRAYLLWQAYTDNEEILNAIMEDTVHDPWAMFLRTRIHRSLFFALNDLYNG